MKFIWLWFGSHATVMLLTLAMQAIVCKTPWRKFALSAAIIVATFAGLGALVYLTLSWALERSLEVGADSGALGHFILSWVEQSGWAGLLAIIGFLCILFLLASASTFAIWRLLYRD